jgi:hypothetical protein
VSRLRPAAQLVVAIVIGALLSGGALVPNARAVTTPDQSSVVLVFDFSASILIDATNRARFGAALEGIAARVDATSADLVAGDATVTIVQFAATAIDYPGCTDLHLLGDPQAVASFADCLRSVAGAYRKGIDPVLTRKIGIDTNYVAAMEQAAKHLPADAVRPTLILFTDGKHDVKGVPVSQVQVVRDRLFGTRSPIALLPVGMGLQPSERAALEAGLQRLQIIKDMPACISGAVFDWPQVVFQTADEAGNAVAVALQGATCTFTVAPVATPAPTPPPTVGAVQGIQLTAGDGQIEVAWSPPAAGSVAIVDYQIRCRAGDGTTIESTEGVSLQPTAVVEGLTDGTAYTCEVAVVGPGSTLGPWTAASATATPVGKPAAPGKPSVEALNQAVQIAVAAADPALVSGFHYECSGDDGATWPSQADAASSGNTTAQVSGLANGTAYVCRAFALNAVGKSDASPISDAVRPCGTALECTPVLVPVLGVLGIVLVGGLILVLVALARSRRRGYVIAIVDVVHTTNLGYGSKLGIGFVRDPMSRQVTGVVADRSSKADIRVHHLGGGRFVVADRHGRHVATEGEPFRATDSVGARHEVVLRAFNTKAASAESSYR